jgi:hypothetical protein
MFDDTVFPPDGEVNLKDKESPVCTRLEFDDFYVYTRGHIDILPFKSYLLSLPQEMWQDENQVGNVNLIRPGINVKEYPKFLFIFSCSTR